MKIIRFLLLLLLIVIITSFTIKTKYSLSIRSTLLSMSNLKDKIYLYNTMTREKVSTFNINIINNSYKYYSLYQELFKTIKEDSVSFYSCGPTVYDYAHIGNFRAFLTYDILKRWLEYCEYKVDHVCNLTDIDDKIIVKMIKEKKSLKELTEKYIQAFFEDLEVLNIKKAQRYPKVSSQALHHYHDYHHNYFNFIIIIILRRLNMLKIQKQ